jgi:hypothetical protein
VLTVTARDAYGGMVVDFASAVAVVPSMGLVQPTYAALSNGETRVSFSPTVAGTYWLSAGLLTRELKAFALNSARGGRLHSRAQRHSPGLN